MLKGFVKILSRLPLGVHYWIADYILYPLIVYVVRYRRKLVQKNLRESFPEMSKAQLSRIERDFYHQFTYTAVETVYGYHLTNDELRPHILIENTEMLNDLVSKAGGGIITMGHLGNWEWLASLQNWLDEPILLLDIYRSQRNKAMDELMLDIRAQRDGECVEKKRILREMIRYRAEKRPVLVGLINDQKPRPEVTRTWLTFLNHDTGFLDGAEVLAKKFNYPIFFMHITRNKRGYYIGRVVLLSDNPTSTAEGEITTAFAREVEKNIIEQPCLWLWTHNRWKWKRAKS